MIKKIVFEVETITPMFLSGADQGKAELRAASIKGLMRYWWRAVCAQDDIEQLRNDEARLFGSSNEKIGGSKFSIRVTQPDNNPLLDLKSEIADRNGHIQQTGIGYLLYSTFMRKTSKRPYFQAGSSFRITIASRHKEQLSKAAASFWTLVFFGGIGSRARRGAGNIVVTEVEDKHGLLGDSGLDFMPKGGNMQEIAGWVADNFSSVKRILTDDRTGFASKYSNLSICRCIIGSANFSTWKEALNEAGTIFKKFRDKNKGRFFDSGAFGLPIIHRSSHTAVKGRIENSAINRRSSPLVFKIIRVNDQYFWMVLRLAGEFLPEGGVISANRESSKPDYGIIDEFWAEIKEKGKEYMFSMPQMLKDMIEKIKNEVDPKKIILFGSKAMGDFHRRSDTDIAIDTEKPLANLSLLGAADIVNFREADKKLKEKIEKEGVVIYERTG